MKPSLEELEIRTGALVDPNLLYLLLEDHSLAEQDTAHTVVGVWQRGKDWITASLNYNAISVAVKPGAPGVRQVVIVGNSGNSGNFTVSAGGKATTGEIDDETELASASYVNEAVMAVGIVGGVYRMKDASSWEDLTDKRVEENIEAVCGHPSGAFVVCGWQGLVAVYENGGVERIETGTNVILTDIICDDKGEIVVCGQRGTVLRGTTDALVPLQLAGIADDFWSVAKFQGEVYLASTTALYRLVDNSTLELVPFEGEEIPTSFYHLNTYEDSLMLSVGQKDAVLFDGNEWTRIL